MHNLFPFILGVIFVSVNGLTQLVFAQTQGFKLKPASIGLLIAAAFSGILGLVTPITGQSAMIALAGKTEERDQRVAALLLSSLMMTVLGLTGAISTAVEFAGPAIMAGMMAGVGLMLAGVGSDFIIDKQKGNFTVGVVSLVSAFMIYFLFYGDANVLVYTVAGSVALSTAYYLIFQREKMEDELALPEGETENGKFWTKEYWQTDDWKMVTPKFTFKALLSSLALICLGVGITTSFGAINAGMAGVEQNFDHLTLVSGMAGFASELFGGMPLETIISGTAAAPWPVLGNVSVLVLLAVLLILGVVTKISKYMPTQSIAGFLVIIGIFSTFLPQLNNSGFASDIPVAGVTMAVTKLTNNPFIGVLAGLATREFGHFIGLYG
jgi:AGZA family xanthine/uracil permease-like MFS transporter